jgi:hypothetical protein
MPTATFYNTESVASNNVFHSLQMHVAVSSTPIPSVCCYQPSQPSGKQYDWTAREEMAICNDQWQKLHQ